MNNGGETREESKRRQTGLIVLVLLAVVMGLVLALLIPAGGALETVMNVLRRWFFAVFCTLYALAHARVYVVRRHRGARVARDVPVSAFGFFTAVWFALAAAAVVYGILEPAGWWETAAWVTIVLVICIEMIVLGTLYRRSESA